MIADAERETGAGRFWMLDTGCPILAEVEGAASSAPEASSRLAGSDEAEPSMKPIHYERRKHDVTAIPDRCLRPGRNMLRALFVRLLKPETRNLASRAAASVLWTLALPALAAEPVAFRPELPTGTLCRIEVALLHPTQFAVGAKEAEMRAGRVGTMKPDKLERYLRGKIAPVVVGPGGVPYLLDHHHLALLLTKTGASRTMYANIRENWRELSGPEFWTRMKERNWAWLFDENGRGPLDPAQLPPSMAGLRDDPFRSLAWAVRQQDGYRDSGVLFADFRWADFFRSRVKIPPGPDGFDRAVAEALKLARTPAAKDLPGYRAP